MEPFAIAVGLFGLGFLLARRGEEEPEEVEERPEPRFLLKFGGLPDRELGAIVDQLAILGAVHDWSLGDVLTVDWTPANPRNAALMKQLYSTSLISSAGR